MTGLRKKKREAVVRCRRGHSPRTNNSHAVPGVALVCRGDDELYFDAERVFPVRLGVSRGDPVAAVIDGQR